MEGEGLAILKMVQRTVQEGVELASVSLEDSA